MILVGLSSTEKIAVKALIAEAKRTGITKKPWADPAVLDKIDLDALTEQAVLFVAPILKVQKALEKPMKPGRECLSVVRYKNGAIEQITDRTVGLIGLDREEEPDAAPEEAPPAPDKEPVAAVTVAQPTRGCPAPDFAAVEHRANRVLRAFLTPQQVHDFDTQQAFVTRGADTGHLYMVTSRSAPTRLSVHRRSLFDLTENQPYCVHDWTVPAAEEMLCLHLHVSTPGREHYVRSIPDTGDIG